MMDTRLLLGFAAPEHAALCARSRATWWRWKTGRARVPRAALNLLHILVGGEAIQGGQAWRGWRFVRGELIGPEGCAHTPGTIASWHWLAQELQALRARENQQSGTLPPSVAVLPGAAHALTRELARRLEGER